VGASSRRSWASVAAGLFVSLVLGSSVGWAILALGGHTDAAGRLGLLLGLAVFACCVLGWGRGRRGWLQGLAAASLVGCMILAHYLSHLGHVL
jgi:hypothetical protein